MPPTHGPGQQDRPHATRTNEKRRALGSAQPPVRHDRAIRTTSRSASRTAATHLADQPRRGNATRNAVPTRNVGAEPVPSPGRSDGDSTRHLSDPDDGSSEVTFRGEPTLGGGREQLSEARRCRDARVRISHASHGRSRDMYICMEARVVEYPVS